MIACGHGTSPVGSRAMEWRYSQVASGPQSAHSHPLPAATGRRARKCCHRAVNCESATSTHQDHHDNCLEEAHSVVCLGCRVYLASGDCNGSIGMNGARVKRPDRCHVECPYTAAARKPSRHGSTILARATVTALRTNLQQVNKCALGIASRAHSAVNGAGTPKAQNLGPCSWCQLFDPIGQDPHVWIGRLREASGLSCVVLLCRCPRSSSALWYHPPRHRADKPNFRPGFLFRLGEPHRPYRLRTGAGGSPAWGRVALSKMRVFESSGDNR
jgi:hypothetical protein